MVIFACIPAIENKLKWPNASGDEMVRVAARTKRVATERRETQTRRAKKDVDRQKKRIHNFTWPKMSYLAKRTDYWPRFNKLKFQFLMISNTFLNFFISMVVQNVCSTKCIPKESYPLVMWKFKAKSNRKYVSIVNWQKHCGQKNRWFGFIFVFSDSGIFTEPSVCFVICFWTLINSQNISQFM